MLAAAAGWVAAGAATPVVSAPPAARAAAAPAAPFLPAPAAGASGAVRQGIAVDFSLEPAGPAPAEGHGLREDEAARLRFTVRDAATGTPVAGGSPAAWMERLAEGKSAAEGCTARVQSFLAGNVFDQPELDLNAYYVLALNDDASISVVDPRFGFGGSKLLTMIQLASPGEDWALAAGRGRLFVSLPEANRVAVIDTASFRVIANLDVGGRPGRLALQPDGAYLWVAVEGHPEVGAGAGTVAAIDPGELRVAARLPTGRGRHDLALSGDGRFVLVSNRQGRSLTVIDARRLARVADVALEAPPAAIAWSAAARAAYVASEEAGTIVAVDPERRRVVARLQAEPGLAALRFAPGGRFGFVVNPRRNRVLVLDAALNRLVQSSGVEEAPDQVTFTDHLAYIRHRGSETVLMIPIDKIGSEGQPLPLVDFPAGQHALGQVSRPSLADSIVAAPGGASVLVANPADRAIYFYKEGMAAPMGSFSNYGREPRAVLVDDRSLRERAPGSYETVARLQAPGRYRVAFFLDAPRAIHCFEAAVAPDPRREEQRLRERPAVVERLFAPSPVAPGEKVELRFRLRDPGSGRPEEGLTDVSVLIYQAAGGWHARQWARAAGEGIYAVDFVPPEAGSYYVAVECRSRRLPFHLSPPMVLEVGAPKAAPGAGTAGSTERRTP